MKLTFLFPDEKKILAKNKLYTYIYTYIYIYVKVDRYYTLIVLTNISSLALGSLLYMDFI